MLDVETVDGRGQLSDSREEDYLVEEEGMEHSGEC